MRYTITIIAMACLLTACSDGVEVAANNGGTLSDNGSVSADGAVTNADASLAINDPLNSALEPAVQAWVGASRQRLAECSAGLSQNVQNAFATDAFLRVDDENGFYLLSTRRTIADTPEYIEFCVTSNKLARYRIRTSVLANDISEDSFFVTIDEDAPDTVADPGIYDVSRGPVFNDDLVRTRTENPLVVTLTEGTHVIRFYLREPNTAIRSITLEEDTAGAPVLDPDNPEVTAIAQCAANTGLPVAEVESLITQYLGNVERRFVLRPFEEERGFFSRNDYRWDTSEGRGNIMCLAPPPEGGTNLIDNTITEGRLVIGSQGVDEHRVATPLRGTFIGNDGDDSVGAIDGGVFIAGNGDDFARLIRSGVMDGGEGNDSVGVMRDGEFLGGGGNDSLVTQFAGLFDGGDGNDSVRRQTDSATSNSVEDGGVSFDILPAPTNLQFTDSTSSSTLVRWDAPDDARVLNYILPFAGSSLDEIALDLGIDPRSVSPNLTSGTQLTLDNIVADTPLVQVRAYTELDDGSFLYSAPLEGVFVPPEIDNPDSFIASVELSDAASFGKSTLAANGSVVVANSRAPIITSTPAFIRFDTALQNEMRVFDDSLANSTYSTYTGDTRQYVLIFDDRSEWPNVIAFNGDVSTLVWEQRLLDTQRPVSGGSGCLGAIVTQDDWLVCSTSTGSLVAFDPDGNRYQHPNASLELFTTANLTDGSDGKVVQISKRQDSDIPSYTVFDLISGEKQTFAVSLADAIIDAKLLPEALAVDGEHLLLSGQFLRNCTLDNTCSGTEGREQGFYLARALIADGSVSVFTSGELADRAGDGIGKLVDGTAFFSRGDAYSRYQADNLELISRASVPGTIQDFSADAVLSREFIGFPIVEGNRLILSQP